MAGFQRQIGRRQAGSKPLYCAIIRKKYIRDRGGDSGGALSLLGGLAGHTVRQVLQNEGDGCKVHTAHDGISDECDSPTGCGVETACGEQGLRAEARDYRTAKSGQVATAMVK